MARGASLWCAALLIVGCGDPPETAPEQHHQPPRFEGLSPVSIALRGDHRHTYEITQPPIESPHTIVGDEIWRLGNGHGPDAPDWSEPAPFTRSTPVALRAVHGWRGASEALPDAAQIEVLGTLRSTTDPEWTPEEIIQGRWTVARGHAETTEVDTGATFDPIEIDSNTLPNRVDLFELTLEWRLTPLRGNTAGGTKHITTRHLIPTTFRPPLPFVRYRQIVTWGSAWAAGDWSDDEESAHQIGLKLLDGIRGLEDQGFSYGRVQRPSDDVFESWADTLLDTQRAACGEYRGLLIALFEYHGIAAERIWFHFPDNTPDAYGFYMTHPTAPIGGSERVWMNTNHSVVVVGERIYDPTYTIHAPNWQTYEDAMFARYCKGTGRPCTTVDNWCHRRPDDEAARCIDNPPGFDPTWDFKMTRDDPRN